MKTKNNVQKAITKTLAVIVSLVLISITVQAQDFWKSVLNNNSFNQIAMAMTGDSGASATKAKTSSANIDAKDLENEVEPALNIENWMLNKNNFFMNVDLEAEVENSLQLDDWMTNENLFDGTAAWFNVETENALQLEDWMINQNTFGVKTIELEVEPETGLQMEAWMTNNKIWKI